MQENIKFFVGMDVHKDSISWAVAPVSGGAARFVGVTPPERQAVLKVLQRWEDPRAIQAVYEAEAGPTGYGLQRTLSERGYRCQVVAPSLIPRRPGDRIKTDRRYSVRLAELARAGELTAIWIPEPQDEAVRDVSRAREDAAQRAPAVAGISAAPRRAVWRQDPLEPGAPALAGDN